MTTRDHDIAKIEEDMAKGLISRERGMRLIDKMYKQTKDRDLESKRKKLIEDQKARDRKYRLIRTNPEKLHPEEQKRLLEHFRKNPHEF